MTPSPRQAEKRVGYAPVNGLQMYYEIEGTGDPLVYIPAILGCAGMKSFPALTERHAVITPDLQGHGRTADISGRPLTLEQCAEDVAGLLEHLGIPRADFLGESYGGAIATLLAVRRPKLVGRVATYGSSFGPPNVTHNPAMLRFDRPPTPGSAAFRFMREQYEKVAPNPAGWAAIWEKVAGIRWEGFSSEELASIQAPVLVALGDRDFIRVEHAVDIVKRLPRAELAVIPDAGHFALFSEPERVIPVIQHFLEKSEAGLPVATAQVGYYPGESR